MFFNAKQDFGDCCDDRLGVCPDMSTAVEQAMDEHLGNAVELNSAKLPKRLVSGPSMEEQMVEGPGEMQSKPTEVANENLGTGFYENLQGRTGSCSGNCFGRSNDCFCDVSCVLNGDCCSDAFLLCPLDKAVVPMTTILNEMEADSLSTGD